MAKTSSGRIPPSLTFGQFAITLDATPIFTPPTSLSRWCCPSHRTAPQGIG